MKQLKSVDCVSLLPIVSILYCSLFLALLSPSSFNEKINVISSPFFSPSEIESMLAKAKQHHDKLFLFAIGVSGLSMNSSSLNGTLVNGISRDEGSLFADTVYDVL